MKKTILIMGLWIILGSIQAQSIERDVLASSGVDTEQLSWTVGEIAVETYEQGDVILTQGFHQDYYSITQKIEKTAVDYSIEVFPNPVREKLFIRIPYSIHSYTIEMYGIKGNKVFEKKDVYAEVIIQMDEFPVSTYFLKVIEDSKLVATYKLIRE